ncbi:patatin-like phospholipase family protein [Tenacibaculum maritimum]|uniref:PNPLA domain-containing protein n=1 Tax=Tenacibaculum maritimum NCIMB 2154 TaxID=1349785 RepID=A0A2H1EAQ2_9FLAO|nr:patatin-like phospholipase family protein [Tenacibaculum maritimum]MCD9583494.1 patatin-like phospholipase family protein [Tenacibaculum maritimum]MCD9610249.1 patatin-like phospholipase family protein [Tenacibaculum maritimum]MCD9620321.1 patatin-like phospholipase family protein [Tenacibaculum maritimum]MCD9627119.1 patatin-like phospholipase family protein [Tenacibaculum maritimum]MCD9631423.1 patatin-like phospholipase family protein [Tenacibaculum maritimum]
MKKALVISGGGSKGAFAGGVAEYLIKKKKKEYDLFLGTSTGSLMVSHLALGMVDELKELYTSVNQNSIFSNSPFKVKKVNGAKVIAIRHTNTFWNFINGRKTFGESKNLKKLIKKNVTKEMYEKIRNHDKDVVVTVSNLTANQVEYKSIKEYSYDDFCDWIWGSCNYVPFMSLLEKNKCQYADGGFGCLIPIREAILRGAKEIDAIILETEITQINRLPARNPFSLMLDVFDFMLEHVERHNVTIGKLSAKHNDVALNLYYTPTVLTTNSLVFDKKEMRSWWKAGYKHAKKKHDDTMSDFRPELIDNKEVEEGMEYLKKLS